MKKVLLLALLVVGFTYSCKKSETDQNSNLEETETITIVHRDKNNDIHYKLMEAKSWLNNNKDSVALQIVTDVNRTDIKNLAKMDSILIPDKLNGKREDYLPFPLQVESIKNIDKVIFFSYATQTFAAYKNGTLVYTGPTNMGREKDPTPTGLFFTNWKAEESTSTFNDEWDLKWNFNIENKLGVGFHQYELPGYPASHSCLRLQEKDARYLYDWANQWVLIDDENIKSKGTPVVVFGEYSFKAKKPWLQLLNDPEALEISEEEISQLVQPKLETILKEQKNSKMVARNSN